MDFDFSPEQMMLRDQARDFLVNECPSALVRQMMDDERGHSPALWRQMADLGLLSVAIPEEYGGLGMGMVEHALILEQMGRTLCPGPYFATTVLTATAILAGGTAAQKQQYLSAIAAGDLIGTVALLEDEIAWDASGVHAQATPVAGGYRLNGLKRLVPFAKVADFVIVPARIGGPDGDVSLFLVDRATDGVTVTPLVSLDMTEKVSQIELTDAMVPAACVLGQPGNGAAVFDAVVQRAAVAAAAEMVGAARASLDMSVEYAKTREQFGQPIGSFQAVKHRLADMLVDAEAAFAATYYAAWAQDDHGDEAQVAAHVAKAYTNEAARKICGDAIQVHGGIGFTWEYDLHLYFKRAKHYEALYGDTQFHREKLAQHAGAAH
ncbi:MAG: acyl-CoA dehydrogenase family protein [Anaerolineae bacterium]